MSSPPILDNKDPNEPSVFEPTALLREARRQKGLPVAHVPPICILDPDGDVARRLKNSGQARRSDTWPCYHTDLYEFALGGTTVGIIGCAVGALQKLTPWEHHAYSRFQTCRADDLWSSAGRVLKPRI